MSIHRVHDIEFVELASQSYDTTIFASGYESRCTFIPKQINHANVKTPVVIGFEDLAHTEPRKLHDAYFLSHWQVEPEIASSSNDFVIQSRLNSIVSNGGPIQKILVDCSSMSRMWYAGILNWARFGNCEEETIIDFVYALGRYEDDDLSPTEIEDMVLIPGCEGTSLQLRESLAIFGLGFNGWASLSVLEQLEADSALAFIASPGASPDYPEKVRSLNSVFLSEPCLLREALMLPIRSVEASYRILSELLSPYRQRGSVTLVPMGPKPHVLACILLAMQFPDVSCMRVSTKRARPEKVEPTGEIVAVRVTVRKSAI